MEDRYFHLIDAEDRARTALRDYQTAADVVYNDQVRDAVQVIRDAAGVLGSLGNVSDSPTAVLKAVGDIFNRYAAELERLHSVSPRDIHLRELAARADALESAVRLCAHERDEFTEALDALWECAAHRRPHAVSIQQEVVGKRGSCSARYRIAGRLEFIQQTPEPAAAERAGLYRQDPSLTFRYRATGELSLSIDQIRHHCGQCPCRTALDILKGGTFTDAVAELRWSVKKPAAPVPIEFELGVDGADTTLSFDWHTPVWEMVDTGVGIGNVLDRLEVTLNPWRLPNGRYGAVMPAGKSGWTATVKHSFSHSDNWSGVPLFGPAPRNGIADEYRTSRSDAAKIQLTVTGPAR